MNYTALAKMPHGAALIYKIENVQNGSMYIGSTVEPVRRWRNHVKLLKNGSHTSFVLQRAWDKHGESAFVYAALFVCPKDMRYFYETRAIKVFGVYNLLKDAGVPGPGSMLGKKHSEAGRKNLSEGAKRRWADAKSKHYNPLCEKAWQLVLSGIPRYKACKQIGVSHDTFWNWLGKNGKKEGIRGPISGRKPSELH